MKWIFIFLGYIIVFLITLIWEFKILKFKVYKEESESMFGYWVPPPPVKDRKISINNINKKDIPPPPEPPKIRRITDNENQVNNF